MNSQMDCPVPATRAEPALSLSKGVPAPHQNLVLRGLRVLGAALREIFDEAAYGRFLARENLTSSSMAYAAFRREQELAKARRPRCC